MVNTIVVIVNKNTSLFVLYILFFYNGGRREGAVCVGSWTLSDTGYGSPV